MLKEIFLIFFIATLALGFNQDWKEYKAKYGIDFETHSDERDHFLKFVANKHKIKKHNEDPNATYKMGENKFLHLDSEEFKSRYLMTVPSKTEGGKRFKRQTTTTNFISNLFGNYTESTMPNQINYTYLMQAVMDQGECASCYAFAALGQIEALLKFRDPSFNSSLSPQYILDCDPTNYGCDGGWPYDTLEWLINNSGGGFNVAPTIESYPYRTAQGTCKNNITNFIPLGLSGIQYFDYLDEISLMLELANNGPLIAIMEATLEFAFYQSGIFRYGSDSPESCTKEVNHAVLLVGYGTNAVTGETSWLVKNNWGNDWGETGYFSIARGVSPCGTASRNFFYMRSF